MVPSHVRWARDTYEIDRITDLQVTSLGFSNIPPKNP